MDLTIYTLTHKHFTKPDVLMEASDVTGELHLMLQITAVMDMQIQCEGGSFYKRQHLR